MIINPHEADTVRFIFQSVLNGIGTEKIADILETYLGRAGHKWSQHNRHSAVPFVFQGPGRHDAGDGAAEAH